MEQKKTESDKTYWHPAFFAGIQIEFKDDADNLEFENEHQLGTNPMEIDVLVIKKETGKPVKTNLGKIFRKYNIIEYKSPDDFLSIDDFYKVYGYTCFYKADVPFVNSIPIQELTLTFVSEKYPQNLARHLLEERNFIIEKTEPGIYLVHGDFLPIQFIVTKKLSEKNNLWLKSLTNKLQGTDSAQKLVADYLAHPKNKLYQSVIETIMKANKKLFQEVNSMDDIVMEIVQEKFDKKLKEAVDREVKQIIDQRTEEVTQQVTEKVTQQVTRQVTEEVTQQVTRQVTKEVTQQVIKKTKLMDMISLVQKKCRKNKPLSVIADELEIEPDKLLSVYTIVFQNPGKSIDELYEIAVK